jgi:septal ring factor EnvC (AmiA/AmiB activator)
MANRCSSYLLIAFAIAMGAAAVGAQDSPGAQSAIERASERIRSLQQEADALASQEKTLLGELRKLEIERRIKAEEVARADAQLRETTVQLDATVARAAALSDVAASERPDVESRLVQLYKLGRGGYWRLLLDVADVQSMGRAYRTAAAMNRLDRERIQQHQRTLEALATERAALEARARETAGLQEKAAAARAALDRAVAARTELVASIDARRDLNAQLAGELQVAYDRLQQQLASLGSGRAVEPVAIPIAPFRGALDWPVAGRISGRFGQRSGRFGDPSIRNGIEIAALEGSPVRALHSGTVSYADPFAGFGNLVIVDHGANTYSLYGYLASMTVARGTAVDSGTEVGRVGSAPAGPAAVYLEIRVDGRSVDPVQWLKPR